MISPRGFPLSRPKLGVVEAARDGIWGIIIIKATSTQILLKKTDCVPYEDNFSLLFSNSSYRLQGNDLTFDQSICVFI